MPIATYSSSRFQIRPHPHLYEINLWSWLERMSAQSGRTIQLEDVPDAAWDSIARRGFDIVWLMGVWRRSSESRRIALEDPANFPQFDGALPRWKPSDVIGSPYAVALYVPDARIGTWDSIDRVRNKLHARGMALFLDFVGNHTALDHPWTREHAEYYVQASQQEFESHPSLYYPSRTPQGTRFLALAKDPYFPPWKDVAQLNYFHSGMRAAQLLEIRTIASHCDGVRCDMAMLLLNDIFASLWGRLLGETPTPKEEFWSEVRMMAPDLTLLGEAYWGTEPRLLDLGFEFAYDKSLYDAVRDANACEVRGRLESLARYQSHFARFMENHDEPRRSQTFPGDRLVAAGTLLGTLPGMRFYHQGELEGRTIRLPITLRVAAEEPADPSSASFFQEILEITKQDVFHKGEWTLLEIAAEGDAPSGGLIVYEWRSGTAWKVIAVNLGGTVSQGRVRWKENVFSAAPYTFYDEINHVTYTREGEELRGDGLFVRLEAFRAHLFAITIAP